MHELFYRTLYVLLTTGLLLCFTYFTVAIQLEYYDAYFASYYQATEFAFDQSVACFRPVNLQHSNATESIVKQVKAHAPLLNWINDLQLWPQRFCAHSYDPKTFESRWVQWDSTLGLGRENNDAKAWSFLCISSMNYFFTLQLNAQRLNTIAMHSLFCHLFIQFCMQMHGFVVPGLLTHQRLYWVALTHLLVLTLVLYSAFYLLYLSALEELNLEQLDSELQITV